MEQSELIKQARKAHQEGDLVTAELLYRQVLVIRPNNPDANHLLGVICFQREEYDTALELIRKAIAVRPDHAASYNNLGSVQKALGMLNEALESFGKAIELQPDFAEAYNNLGTIYKRLGELDQAEKAYNEAIRFRPHYVKALNNLGNLFQEREDYLKSLVLYGKALEVDPELPLTNYNLGCALSVLGRLNEAEAALLQAVQGDPEMYKAMLVLGGIYQARFQFGNALQVLQKARELVFEDLDVLIAMGNLYMAMNRHDKAQGVLQETVAKYPESYQAVNILGLACKHIGKFDDAQKSIDRAHELAPKNPLVLTNKASLYMAQGLFEDCIRACKEALVLKPECAPAYYQLAQLLEGSEASQAADEIRKLLQQEGRTLAQKIYLGFGLAGLEDGLGQYDKAFVTLQTANKLKRQTFDFSLEQQESKVERILDIFSKDRIDRYSDRGTMSAVPVFIVGMPRSGTTLVEQILSSHPDVHGAGELRLLQDIVADNVNLERTESFVNQETLFSAKVLKKIGATYVKKLHSMAPEAKRVTDKMPGNFLYIGLIHLLMPRAKIIHVIRDPKDTCLSIFKKLFTYGHQYAYDLDELGRYYLLYLKVMEHWRKVIPEVFLDFRYEDLVQNQEEETRRLLDFCELDWYEGCLRYFESKRAVLTASTVQVRQPISSRSIGLWKRYNEGLQPLLSVLESP